MTEENHTPIERTLKPYPLAADTDLKAGGETEYINPPTPIVFGGQFQDVEASDTVKEGETRNYVDDAGHNNEAEIVGHNPDGTVNILVPAGVGRIRRDNVPWKKEGMKAGYVE